MLLVCMMGITNHWIAFAAEKNTNGIQFFMFDSRNRDFMEWKEA